ncbi:MAG TPA: hypothetical protein VHV51_12525 [Polyangiaceae bacterium]|jgi:hypothetical protein|nr:hypothetical protein [Polyangiaceae bacterium]
MRLSFWPVVGAVSLLFSACAPQVATPPQAPSAAPAPSNWKPVEPSKQKVSLVPEPAGVPAPEAFCQSFAAHAAAVCANGAAPREALVAALDVSDAALRDDALSCLEQAPEFPPGLVRALRAELAPIGCADALALPFLDPRRPGLDRRIEDTLIALAAAGRLSRVAAQAPALGAPFDKQHFNEFFQSTLKPWIIGQAAAIHDLSALGPSLTPYAKGVLAIEAGLADMRFVSIARAVALPKEMSDDDAVREAYYAALDEALEPRKARGRDAALVGLLELAKEGVLVDPRVERARKLLSEVYSGRRIDALDQLLLPELPPSPDASLEQKLAARLPTFYAGFLLATVSTDAPLLRALLERGLPRSIAQRLNPSQLDDAAKALLVRALIERGRRYLRAEDFASAVELSSALSKPTPEVELYRALGSALKNGPRDASDVLLHGPLLPSGTGQVTELDQLASQKNESAPLAAFDAAYLLSLVPPQNDPKFWEDLSKRFDKAAHALRAPEQKKLAKDSSRAAKQTAKALRDNDNAKSQRTPSTNAKAP